MATSASRDTTTGLKFENSIIKDLEKTEKYKIEPQKRLDVLTCQAPYLFGAPIDPTKAKGYPVVDIVINGHILVELKKQTSNGTAEQKIPWAMQTLQHQIDRSDEYDHGIMVLSGPNRQEIKKGEGWTLKRLFLEDKKWRDINRLICPDVTIVSEEEFYEEFINPYINNE